MIPTLINGRWTLLLPDHRHERPEWPWWEKPRLESMRVNLKPGDLIYDVGAEEGDMSALYSQWGCDVVLLEPNPRVWPNIRAIWDANNLAEPRGCWVGFAGPTDDIHRPEWVDTFVSEGWPECAFGPLIGDHGFLNLCERPDVPIITIDTLTERYGIPNAITMDIEGAELQALKGAERTLRENDVLVWVSVHPEFIKDMYGQSHTDVTDFMGQVGFREYHLAAEHEHHRLYFKDGTDVRLPYSGELL